MIYTGIGSRDTPTGVLRMMTKIAQGLAKTDDAILRSGGAKGADSAFEDGADKKEIYLPWKGFNDNDSPLFDITNEAYEMAKHYHPAWNRCSSAARKFHARNCYQVLGKDLDTPTDLVICWTPGGKITGGTGQALRIALDYNININNLYEATQ